MFHPRPKETMYLSRKNDLFVMSKLGTKWHLVGKSLDGNHATIVGSSSNKKRLVNFINSLGLVKV
jgi:hypothetical protein